MFKQRFPAVFREALWKAHYQKCVHCNRQMLFSELEVDHLLPERLLTNDDERRSVLLKCGLEPSFNIIGRENLGPSCPKCNSDKGQRILPEGRVSILVVKIRDRLAEVAKIEKEMAAAKDLDSLLRAIMRAIESGTVSMAELKSKLDSSDIPTHTHLEFAISLESNEEEPIERRLKFESRVLQAMKRRRIGLPDVVAEIRSTLENPATKIDRRSRSAYLIRGSNGLHICFEAWRDTIHIRYAEFK